jgi:hypothetical protein
MMLDGPISAWLKVIANAPDCHWETGAHDHLRLLPRGVFATPRQPLTESLESAL